MTARPRRQLDVPMPGRPVRGSTSGQPLMALLDLLGRRWTLRILWELRNEPLGFRALRRACDDMSQSVLTVRLGELQATGLVTVDDSGCYRRTPAGDELGQEVLGLHRWAERWATAMQAPPDQPDHAAFMQSGNDQGPAVVRPTEP